MTSNGSCRHRCQQAVMALLVSGALAACGSTTNGAGPGASTSTTTKAGTSTTAASGEVPLGDGKVLSDSAKVGYVDSCSTTAGRGGAQHDGPWIHADGAWSPSQKIAVQGSVSWPAANYHVSVSGGTRTITGNDLPVGATTGTFPIAASDPAYQYDRNPNHIQAADFTLALPASPTVASTPGCLPLGPIGVMTDGVFLYNALDDALRDAGAHEVQDHCLGHPDGQSRYHYHSVSSCLPTSGTATLVGYALDGYGIYVERNADGSTPTDADLDACHGRTSAVPWDGHTVSIYHYVATTEYPYTLGCFHGTVSQAALAATGHR